MLNTALPKRASPLDSLSVCVRCTGHGGTCVELLVHTSHA